MGKKKHYTLEGVNGNAFSVMGYVARAMRAEGKSDDEINAYYSDAQSDDYNHLLYVSQQMLESL